MIYPSDTQYESFNPIEEWMENKKYGKFIKYEAEFLEETREESKLFEGIQAAISMDIPWIIGGHTENSIKEAQDFLNQKNAVLLSPYISINREIISSKQVLSLLPNSTEKARLFAELLQDENLDCLITFSNSELGEGIVNFYQGETIVSNSSDLNETLSQFGIDSEIGVFVDKSSMISAGNIPKLNKTTVYCETLDNNLDAPIKVFGPISSDLENYNEFVDMYTDITGKNPTYTDALLYDACRIYQNAVEISRFSPWDHPEAILEAGKRLEGVTGNCTFTQNGDRLFQKYTLIAVDN